MPVIPVSTGIELGSPCYDIGWSCLKKNGCDQASTPPAKHRATMTKRQWSRPLRTYCVLCSQVLGSPESGTWSVYVAHLVQSKLSKDRTTNSNGQVVGGRKR